MQGDSRLDTVGIIPVCIDPGPGLSRMAERDSVMRRRLLITDGIPVPVIAVSECDRCPLGRSRYRGSRKDGQCRDRRQCQCDSFPE